MKALICYNPYSGKQAFERDLPYVNLRLKEKYDEVIVFRSVAPKSITTFIKNFAVDFDLILIAGGDGSLNEAINGIMTLNYRPKIAYIPYGTVNDVGHMLKLNNSIEKTMDIILEGNKVEMDICKIDDRYFTYACAAGSFTNVSYEASSRLKKTFGRMAYFIEAAKEISLDQRMNLTIETNDQVITGTYYVVMALNSKRLAGFRIHRREKTKLNDGIIDLTLLSMAKFKMSVFRLIFFFLFGEKYKYGMDYIKTGKFKLKSDKPLNFNVDGEFAFTANEINLEVCPRAIDFIVNKKVYKQYFQ